MKNVVLSFIILSSFCNLCIADELEDAINLAQEACSGISASMDDMKVMAGINTGVTGVGTVSGGVAFGAGIAKSNLDSHIDSIEQQMKKLSTVNEGVSTEALVIENKKDLYKDIDELVDSYADSGLQTVSTTDKKNMINKSKMLGNLRTGTLAVSGASNIAGAAIAATNKVSGGFREKVNSCILSIKNLVTVHGRARIEKTSSETNIEQARQIISACREWETADLKSVNDRATGVVVASSIGAGTGVLGTIISAVANTDKTRSGDKTTEKNLNTTANVMAGTTTVASATATIFNATQIAAIKKVVNIADKCEGAL